MESVSRSRLPSKKSGSSNGYAGKAIYDDVFGGPPQFGVPTLSPRTEDYTEIFQSFHSSRASSIPVLDLPVVDGEDLSFDVRSSKFDYSEIFGGFNTLDFAVSYEELFNHSNGGDDSSDEDWTPAQSDSLSDGSDPFTCPQNNQSLSNPDPDPHSHQSFDSSEQFNVSHDKVNPNEKEDISNRVTYVNNLQVHNDLDFSTEGKRLRKTMSQPSNSKEAFVSVSNISLRTQPSQVPPPSRPPPPFAVEKGDTDGLGLKLRASKSYTFERMTGESSPPYFDVEIDASSSAAASAAAMKDAVEKAEAKLRSAKELMERKREVQSRTKLRLDGDLKHEREVEGEKQIKKSRERKHGMERKNEGSAAWTEGSDFYELVEKEQIMEEKDLLENAKRGESGMQKKGVAEDFRGQQEHGRKIIAAREENQQKSNVKTVNEADRQSKGTFKDEDNKRELKEAEERAELETKVKQQKEAHEREENEKKQKDASEREEKAKKQKEASEREENEKKQKEASEREKKAKKQKEASEREEKMKKEKEVSEREEKEKKQKEVCEREENEKKQKEACEQEMVTMYPVKEDNVREPRLAFEVEQNAKNLKEAVEKKEDESKQIMDSEGEQDEKRPSGACEEDDNEKRVNGVCMEEDDGNSPKEAQSQEDFEKRLSEGCEIIEREMGGKVFFEDESSEKRSAVATEQVETGNLEGLRGQLKNHEHSGNEESERKVNTNQEHVQMEGQKWKESDKYERDVEKVQTPQEDGRTEKEVELVEGLNIQVEENVNSYCKVGFQHEKNSKKGGNGIGVGWTHVENDKRDYEMASNLENPNILTGKREERENIKGFNFSFDQKGKETCTQEEREKEERSKRERELKNGRLRRIEEERERDNERLRKIEEEERVRENERLRKIEEEREREREREKDRMAVDRATLERANGEARERAERTAVERATAEFRQRAMAEAREKLEKATAEARLRAEQRAAVDKATAEARERACEKVLRHSYSSSDLQGPQNVGPSSGSRFLHSSVSFGVESESAQRCKARLERHRRTAERAANALAEKNKRDLLAQREQAERNRLAENLDAEVKRWSSGKEGNLRALLSTLQYILGHDSGWQPAPLTEVITAAAVKKAYRKATLCVHPDKLQQRGATIHQKYICEKVFDLLKEAWNKFNSEER